MNGEKLTTKLEEETKIVCRGRYTDWFLNTTYADWLLNITYTD